MMNVFVIRPISASRCVGDSLGNYSDRCLTPFFSLALLIAAVAVRRFECRRSEADGIVIVSFPAVRLVMSGANRERRRSARSA
jgi:hypothetical protein